MRIIVPDELQRVRLVRARDQGELGILLERPRKVPHLAVDPRRQRRLGKPRPDRRATSAGVVPSLTSRTEPSGRRIWNCCVMVGCM
jgi:hypothetical protein